MSYRIRGRVARTHTNRVANIMVFVISDRLLIRGMYPVKNTDVSSLIIKMFVYSAMKIRANIPALYSILNPDTSSDSPSAKSKGVRFVSAKFVTNQKINITEMRMHGHDIRFVDIRLISIDLWIMRAHNKISDMETSYEIV